jgi:ATP-dependent DNA ligase
MNWKGRAKYLDLEPHEAKVKGYDLVSLKYDGIWCRMVGKGEKLELYSRDNLLKRTKLVPEGNYDFELIGEFMFGTQWAKSYGLEGNFYAFDMYRLGDRDLTPLRYIERLGFMATAVDQLPNFVRKVFMREINDLDYMRREFVEEGGEYKGAFEGLVFAYAQKSKLEFARYKKIFTLDCKIIGYKEGKKRLEGTLGALITEMPNGKKMDVGGGMTDDLRRLIWNNRSEFLGAVIEAEGRGVFNSGKLRHPNLSRFHHEKCSEEVCELLRHNRVFY